MQLSTAQLPNFLRQLCLSPWAVVLSAFGSSFVVVSGGGGGTFDCLIAFGSSFTTPGQLFCLASAVVFDSLGSYIPFGSCFSPPGQLFCLA